MPFLKSLFQKKPGGTTVGNFLRAFSNQATGGLLGTGKNMIPAENPEQTAPENEAINTLGQTAGTLAQPYVNNVTSKVLNSPTGQTLTNTIISTAFKNWLKKNWWLFLFPLAWIVYAIANRNKNKSRNQNL